MTYNLSKSMTDSGLKIGESKEDKDLVDRIKKNLRDVASSIDDRLTWRDDGSAWTQVLEKYSEMSRGSSKITRKGVVSEVMFTYHVGLELSDQEKDEGPYKKTRGDILKSAVRVEELPGKKIIDLPNGRRFTELPDGRMLTDAELMMMDARKVLSLRTPDVNMRLPWYDAMFDIMDKGKHTGISGGDFVLEPAVHQELVKRLAGRTRFERSAIDRMVGYLAHAMGDFPGHQYYTTKFFKSVHQEVRHRRFLLRWYEMDLICTYLHAPFAIASQKEIASDTFMGIIYSRLGR